MADKANGVQRLRELLAASCCAEPWRFNELTQTVVSGQSHPLARITEAAYRLTFAGTTGREGELIVEAINALPGLLADYEQLQAKLEAAERDAARWRWTSQRAWFVDAGAYAFDLRFGPGDFSTEPRNADADDVQQAIDEAMAEDSELDTAIDAAIDAQRQEGKHG